jgi:tetratricopeptide (TPR) repeat protein
MYIPSIGLFVAVTWLLADSSRRARTGPQGFGTAAIVILIGCGFATNWQVRVWKDSETLFRHTLAVTTRNPQAHLNLGNALMSQNRFDEAREQFDAALQINPDYYEAQANIGFIVASQGKLDEAVAIYRSALARKPSSPKFHFLLANALHQQGKQAEAMEEYRRELSINPDHILALNDLAWILATDSSAAVRNGAEAVRLAKRACEMTQFREPQFIGTLAAAYAELGQFGEAVRMAEKAKALAETSGQTELAQRNEELLKLYREGKGVREGR